MKEASSSILYLSPATFTIDQSDRIMYNGIGLTTVRGSATSGHVSKNLSYLRPEFFRNKLDANLSGGRQGDAQRGKMGASFKVNKDVLEHNKKHALEAEVFEFEESLRDSGKYSEDQISTKVSDFRAQQQHKPQSQQGSARRDTSKAAGRATDTHEISARKNEENRKLRSAFGIRDDFVSGSSFDPVAQEQRRKEREAEHTARFEQNKLDREKRVQEQEERRLKREVDAAARAQGGRSDSRDRDRGSERAEKRPRDDSRDRNYDRARRNRNRSNSRDGMRRDRDYGRWRDADAYSSRGRGRSGGGDRRSGAAKVSAVEEGEETGAGAAPANVGRSRSPSRSASPLSKSRANKRQRSRSRSPSASSRSSSSSSGSSRSSGSSSSSRCSGSSSRSSRSRSRSRERGAKQGASKRSRRSRSRSRS